jgi:hypothetical protein
MKKILLASLILIQSLSANAMVMSNGSSPRPIEHAELKITSLARGFETVRSATLTKFLMEKTMNAGFLLTLNFGTVRSYEMQFKVIDQYIGSCGEVVSVAYHQSVYADEQPRHYIRVSDHRTDTCQYKRKPGTWTVQLNQTREHAGDIVAEGEPDPIFTVMTPPNGKVVELDLN